MVNNAGITRDGLMMRMSEQQWDMVINVNLKSAFNFVHACTPIMMRQKAGSIINMASVVGVHGNAGQANYAASKAGMIALAKSIAQELGSRGIRANAIAPGFFIGDQNRRVLINPDGSLTNRSKKVLAKTPMNRFGDIKELNGAVQFLCSEAASFVTGAMLPIDGGFSAFSGV